MQLPNIAVLAILSVIALGAIASLVLLKRGYRQRQAARAEQFRKDASLRGWKLEHDGRTVRYSGRTGGIAWTYATVQLGERQGEVRQASRWETSDVRSKDWYIIWPKGSTGFRAELPEFARNLAYAAIASVLGIDVSVLSDAKQDIAMAEALEGAPVVAAVVSPEGLRLVPHTIANAPADLERLVDLGVRLANVARTRSL
jgi:hypothetical protein